MRRRRSSSRDRTQSDRDRRRSGRGDDRRRSRSRSRDRGERDRGAADVQDPIMEQLMQQQHQARASTGMSGEDVRRMILEGAAPQMQALAAPPGMGPPPGMPPPGMPPPGMPPLAKAPPAMGYPQQQQQQHQQQGYEQQQQQQQPALAQTPGMALQQVRQHVWQPQQVRAREREFFIDNLLVRIHFMIVMIRWTGLAPWEFGFPFSGSLTSTFHPVDVMSIRANRWFL